MSEPAPLLTPLAPATLEPRLWTAYGFASDPWRTVDDSGAIPVAGYAIMSLGRWRTEKDALVATGVPVGITALPSDMIDFARDDMLRVSVIALVFPKFTDGRAYSTARRLREAGYSGDIRATGDVLLDQIPLMLRAGFTSFSVVNAATIRALEAAPLPALSHTYQAGNETAGHTFRSRRAAQTDARFL